MTILGNTLCELLRGIIRRGSQGCCTKVGVSIPLGVVENSLTGLLLVVILRDCQTDCNDKICKICWATFGTCKSQSAIPKMFLLTTRAEC